MKKIVLFNYLKQLLKWLLRGKFHLLTLVVVVITINYLIGYITFYPVYIASIFSILGLFIILTQQLLDAKQFSDYKPNTIRNWIKGFPKITPTEKSISSSITATITAKAHLSVSISDNASLENKVAHLLNEIGLLDKRINQITDNLEKTNNEISSKSNELKSNIEKVNDVLKSLIAGHIIGSYDINFFGIVITICGTLIQIFRV